MNVRPLSLPGLTLALSLTACSSQPANEDVELVKTKAPNPAAVFCVQQDGEYQMTSGQCWLADGTIVDAWDYFREQHHQVGLPNPAAAFCDEHGEYDLTTGNCTLPDDTVVDAWDYYREHH